ncbi:Mismatch repair endonuclease, partial [Globisporangium splendens]
MSAHITEASAAMAATPKATGGALHVLEKRDVQRICSGQSVVDLATAVKELVENALDAGATLIEVKLKEFGKECIEVSDNGSGIAPANYDTIALKHYTSKINRFEDIETVASFGFRGEALSSICQLVSSFSVCTRTKDEPIGAFLEFDSAGKLTKQVVKHLHRVGVESAVSAALIADAFISAVQTQKARPVGTTVVIEELFKPLAVRHKDFHRNIKKHYAKLLKILQAYAVSSTNVKISVVNVTGKHATRQVVIATQAHQSLGDNIASVFGTKFARTLLSVDIDLNESCQDLSRKPATTAAKSRRGHSGSDDENEESDDDDGGGDDEDDEMSASQLEKTRQVVGYVSKVGAGVGRSDNDRQFFFINGRPFDLPKMAKALNEVWRQYEMKQKPACVLNFLLPLGDYDVNVTPDKRETFIKHEAEIIQAFKTQLNKSYEPSRGTFLVQPLLSSFTQDAKKSEEDVSASTKLSQSYPQQSTEPLVEVQEQFEVLNTDPSPSKEPAHAEHSILRASDYADPPPVQTPSSVGGAVIVEVLSPKRTPSKASSPTDHSIAPQSSSTTPSPMSHSTTKSGDHAHSGCCSSRHGHPSEVAAQPSKQQFAKHAAATPSPRARTESPPSSDDEPHPRTKRQRLYRGAERADVRSDELSTKKNLEPTKWSFREMLAQRKQFFKEEVEDEIQRKQKTRLKVPQACSASSESSVEEDNDVAAAALQRVLKKDDFKRMQVLGQFNLGFIIGKLDDDLFIVDQHASDEKFNYETLQQTTVLHQQPLVRPLPLELTAGEEMVILDHLDVFAKNGFTFLVQKDAPATKKLKLLSLPFTKHTQFGVEGKKKIVRAINAPISDVFLSLGM